jgi:HEPN domain-containing protein
MTTTTAQNNNDSRWQVWLKQAKYDLSAAFLSLENEYYEWAAYQAEQAVEKALKSILVQSGGKAPKIHKLGILFGYCNQVSPIFHDTKFNFKHIEAFTFISRYPFLLPDKTKAPHELISERDANQALIEASETILKISRMMQVQLASSNQKSFTVVDETYTPAQIERRVQDITAKLVEAFNPEQIILFGRFARDWGKTVSGTMDILIVTREEQPGSFFERIYQAREATHGMMPIVEPLVYTAAEIKLLREEDEYFLKTAFDEGKVIYEQTPLKK